jgi:oxygen-independent coproporphyrinogen-3 oxidase
MAGLYVHIPFCATACPYCDFAFVVGREQQSQRYMAALTVEFQNRVDTCPQPYDTVYFGGGTPSAISPDLLSRFISSVKKAGALSPNTEVTAEANPNDWAQFSKLRQAGVTRLSLGIQSTHDTTLLALGRTHTGQDARDAVIKARAAGFTNVNIDLIFGAPAQTVSQWEADLDEALSLEIDHVSIYGLTIEPRTPFAKRMQSGELVLPIEDEQAAMYDLALQKTDKAGLSQYEISNFARSGFESRHNLSCWRGDTYLGLGLSAHSYDGETRAWNVRNLNSYMDSIESRGSAVEGTEPIGDETRRIERIMLGLRTRDGIETRLVGDAAATTRLISEDLIEVSGERLTLTRSGKLIADAVCAELVREL